MGRIRYILDKVFLLLVTLGTAMPVLATGLIAGSSIYWSFKALLSEGMGLFIKPPGVPGGSEIGGLGPVILNTIFITGLAISFAAPLGVVVGVYLSENRNGKLSKIVSQAVQMISEMPTIVIGLFVFSVVCLPLGGYSMLAGAVSLAIAALPYIVTQVRETLMSIPSTYREAAYSLGLPRWKTVWFLLVPMSKSGVASAIMLGYMKALGETAPVLLTAGFALYGFYGLLGPSNTVSLLIYKFAQTPYDNYRILAWTASAILLLGSLSLSYLVRRVVGEVRYA
ncbi:MAG: PstA family ABC transporter permease [Infirmifilum sp.]